MKNHKQNHMYLENFTQQNFNKYIYHIVLVSEQCNRNSTWLVVFSFFFIFIVSCNWAEQQDSLSTLKTVSNSEYDLLVNMSGVSH